MSLFKQPKPANVAVLFLCLQTSHVLCVHEQVCKDRRDGQLVNPEPADFVYLSDYTLEQMINADNHDECAFEHPQLGALHALVS